MQSDATTVAQYWATQSKPREAACLTARGLNPLRAEAGRWAQPSRKYRPYPSANPDKSRFLLDFSLAR
jgi:hypothetical protein